jgi:biotin carboxyl carrier protein
MMTRTLTAAALVLLLTLAACGRNAPEAKPATESQTVAPEKTAANDKEAATEAPEAGQIHLTEADIKAAGIRTEEANEAEVHERIAVTATIQANQDRLAHVVPRVPGRLVGITAKLGDRVKAGQTLASLDSIEIGEAHSAYLQADSQFRLAQADFERAEKLHAEQIVPEKDYLRSRSELEKARANLRAATDKLRLMGVPPARSESAVSVFPVSAPFAGTVIEKTAVLGELAQPDKSLFTVADLSVVWIEANLFEKDLGKIKARCHGRRIGCRLSRRAVQGAPDLHQQRHGQGKPDDQGSRRSRQCRRPPEARHVRQRRHRHRHGGQGADRADERRAPAGGKEDASSFVRRKGSRNGKSSWATTSVAVSWSRTASRPVRRSWSKAPMRSRRGC